MMRADSEHLAPAAGAAIACAFLALGLMLLRQMARQEQVLREILRMHQELLDTTRLLILTQQEIRSVTAAGSEVQKIAQAGPRQIVATSSQTVRFSRCTSGPAGSRDLAPAAPRLASQPQTLSQEPPRLGSAAPRRVSVPTGSRDLAHVAAAGFSRCPSGSSSHSVVSQQQHQLSQSAQPRRPRSSTSSGISFCKPAARPPAADSLSQHGSFSVQTGGGVHVSRVGGCLAGTRPVCSSFHGSHSVLDNPLPTVTPHWHSCLFHPSWTWRAGSRFYADKVQRARGQDFQQESVTAWQRVSTF